MGVVANIRAWPRGRKVAFSVVAALVIVLAGAGAWFLFAPKPTSQASEARPEGEAVAQGSFQGADGFHYAQGSVALLRSGGSYTLRFEGYDARSGPDVYFWLIPTTDARAVDAEAVGMKVKVPGGFMGTGQATVRGDFNVPLPAGFDPAKYPAIVAWCDQYNVLFGWAELKASV